MERLRSRECGMSEPGGGNGSSDSLAVAFLEEQKVLVEVLLPGAQEAQGEDRGSLASVHPCCLSPFVLNVMPAFCCCCCSISQRGKLRLGEICSKK